MLSGLVLVWLLLVRLSEHGDILNLEFFNSKSLIKSLSLEPKPKYSSCLFSKSSGEKYHLFRLIFIMREEHLPAL